MSEEVPLLDNSSSDFSPPPSPDPVRRGSAASTSLKYGAMTAVHNNAPTVAYHAHSLTDLDELEGAPIPHFNTEHHMTITSVDETINLYGYQINRIKTIFVWIGSVLTVGILQLLFYWYPLLKVRCTSDKCALSIAEYILVHDDHQNVVYRPVRLMVEKTGKKLRIPDGHGGLLEVKYARYFTYRKLVYLWHPQENRFMTIEDLEANISLNHFHNLFHDGNGLNENEWNNRSIIYGPNLIDVKLKPIAVLLFKEVISPFYIFQIYSVLVWYNDNYQYYASIIVLMSVMSIAMDIFQTRRQEKKLRSMVHSQETISVRRNGETLTIGSETLVPGDILQIPPHGCILQCDAILMNGTVIVNESMLTGESVPVTKVALPETRGDSEANILSYKEHSKHILFCGTQVLQTRYYGGKPVSAVVLRTAYSTLKGQLVRSIMYPKPVDFRFTKDLFKFVGFLSCIAAVGFAYTICIMIIRGSDTRKVILRSLDIITIVVPPALPAAMSIGILAAQMRLRAKQIFCISPSTINTCGAINTVCFDKTGTLTEDGLDFFCSRAVFDRDSDPERRKGFGVEMTEFHIDELPYNGELLKAVASCHSLTTIDNEICGDPLDLILFRKTGWVMEETQSDGDIDETARYDMLQPTVIHSPVAHFGGQPDCELAIMRQFTFSSSLQRMAVIVHNPAEESHQQHLYVKGAPEMIASLCDVDSIPIDYADVVNRYAQHGYRLIAVAKKEFRMNFVKTQRVKREAIECDLTMLGLIVMENRVKKQTLGVINQLNRARIRTIMVTGDNLLTAMSVARECGIIRPNKRAFLIDKSSTKIRKDGRTQLILRQSVSSSEEVVEFDNLSSPSEIESGNLITSSYHLAIAGPTFAIICDEYPDLIERLVCVCDVFARMSPDQKQLLVNKLQEVDYTVAMCGDGANDCAALKAAHAGISLSEAEASIAAPFTSKIADIRCVPMVIREGRAALVTSFGVFKYMAGYSLTQFITIMQLYWLNTNLADFQFLYIDLGLITMVAVFFGYTPASEKLSHTPPPTRLLSLASMLSVIGQLIIIGFFQLFTFIYTSQQPWFIPYAIPISHDDEDRRSMQGTAIFCVSCFQYITLAIIYSKAHPYRKPLYFNIPLCITLLIVTAVSIWVTVQPAEFIIDWFEFDPIPYFANRLFLLMIAVISGCMSYLYEVYFIEHLILKRREKIIKRRQITTGSKDSNRFERILLSIGNEPVWLRSTIAEGCASAPTLDALVNESNGHRPTLQTNGSIRTSNTTTDDSSARKYLSPTNSEQHSDRSSVHLLN
uniref:Cation-transporting ATPase n=1 Tax=Panagrolaimus sp. PS1159 TaxID=55785 RepID=A0AC35FQ25_9BILA